MKWSVLLLLPLAAFAGGTDIENNPTIYGQNHGSNTVRETSTAVGGADYDIGRGSCRFHEGGLTFAWTRADRFCQGLMLVNAGLIDAGARHLCVHTVVGDNYDDVETCVDELSVTVQPEPVLVAEPADDEDEYHEEQLELYEDILTKVRNLEQAQQTAPPPRTIVQQQQFIDDKKRAALEELRQ